MNKTEYFRYILTLKNAPFKIRNSIKITSKARLKPNRQDKICLTSKVEKLEKMNRLQFFTSKLSTFVAGGEDIRGIKVDVVWPS